MSQLLFKSKFLKSTFVSLALILVATSTFATDTFISDEIQANVVGVTEVKASITLDIVRNSNVVAGDSFTIGSCEVSFGNVDETDCSDNAATIALDVDSVRRTRPELEAVLSDLTNVSDPNHGALTVSTASNSVSFTTTNTETSTTFINLINVTTPNITSPTSSIAGVVPVTAQALIVDFIPTAATAANATYEVVLDSASFTYTTVGADTVQTIISALQPQMDAVAGFSCTDESTKITCTGEVGISHVVSATFTPDTTAPVFEGLSVINEDLRDVGRVTYVKAGREMEIELVS
jgi:hypothetical protein